VLPAVWFYLALVTFGWALLLSLELRGRAKQHVKGCPSLPYISPARLDSRILIESDVILVELGSGSASSKRPHLPDAVRLPIGQLESFLHEASHRGVFVFYDSAADPVDWHRVEAILNHHAIPHVFVLRGGLEAWLDAQRGNGLTVAS
jgi:hypothetical protein